MLRFYSLNSIEGNCIKNHNKLTVYRGGKGWAPTASNEARLQAAWNRRERAENALSEIPQNRKIGGNILYLHHKISGRAYEDYVDIACDLADVPKTSRNNPETPDKKMSTDIRDRETGTIEILYYVQGDDCLCTVDMYGGVIHYHRPDPSLVI